MRLTGHRVPLMLGGIATVVGLLAGLPASWLSRAARATRAATEVRIAEVLMESVAVPKYVRVQGARTDWDGRIAERDGRALLTTPSGAVAAFAPAVGTASVAADAPRPMAKLFVVAAPETAPHDPIEGMLVAAPESIAAALAGAPEGGHLAAVFLVVSDEDLYDSLGIPPPSAPVSWPFLALAAAGVVALLLATRRSLREDTGDVS